MEVISQFAIGDMHLQYVIKDGRVGLILVPLSKKDEVDIEASRQIEPLVQVKFLGDAYPGAYAAGMTMRDSATVEGFRYHSQATDNNAIITRFMNGDIEAQHILETYDGYPVVKSHVRLINHGLQTVDIEMLSSASIGMLSPFKKGLQANNLQVHRLRSRWAAEAYLETLPIEQLMLIPSTFTDEVYSEKFSQIGSKPSHKFVPFVGIESVDENLFWGMQLECASSWQIELSRVDNGLSMSGGLADFDEGAWLKSVGPGDSFETPKAVLTTCQGNLDELCHRLTSIQALPFERESNDSELPIVFNEWCTTWANPTHANISKVVDKLKGWPIKYFVIDAGWYKDEAHQWYEKTGDWEVSKQKYPAGLKAVADEIKDAGFVPGIWFEIETCGNQSKLYKNNAHLLHRLGHPLICEHRKFLDFRDPWTFEYLDNKMIALLKECGFGYLKIDSNETIGLGCDGDESLGEGLRQNIIGVEQYFKRIKHELPKLTIENCSAGGQRLVNNFTTITDVSSFSDAFETTDIPIIAANVTRVILPRQSLIWCIVRKDDDAKRLRYTLASGFLGRICFSGDIHDLSVEQCDSIKHHFAHYQSVREVIKHGINYRFGTPITNYKQPKGYQAIVRYSEDRQYALIVVHSFEADEPQAISLPLISDDFNVSWCLNDEVNVTLSDTQLNLTMPHAFDAAVIQLKKQ